MAVDRKSEAKMRLSVSRTQLMFLLVCSFLGASTAGAFVGVNIGTDVSDMPSASDVVALLKKQNITHVRLFDADRQMLLAMANSSIQVMVSVSNNQLLGIGQSSSSAANWVNKNVAAFLPNTNITAIAVGSEVLTTLPNAALVLVPAMKFLHSALVAANLDGQVKVTSPQATDIILDPFPPSSAVFNSSWNRVMTPMLSFLRDSNSFLSLNVYPYYVYVQSNGIFPLDYALFRALPANKEAVDSNTLLHYTNVFDSLIDAAYFSMAAMNFTNIPVWVTETGWPSNGGPTETDATVENAETYNSNLVAHVLNNTGTPKHPGITVNTYIYELFNEDLRSGPESEKNWGLFSANSTPVYSLTGTVSILANETTGVSFCVAISGTDAKLLQAALDWACGSGGADCQAIQDGGSCYEPNTVADHASYAFNSYYHKMGMQSGSCSFNGVAMITPNNPTVAQIQQMPRSILHLLWAAAVIAPQILPIIIDSKSTPFFTQWLLFPFYSGISQICRNFQDCIVLDGLFRRAMEGLFISSTASCGGELGRAFNRYTSDENENHRCNFVKRHNHLIQIVTYFAEGTILLSDQRHYHLSDYESCMNVLSFLPPRVHVSVIGCRDWFVSFIHCPQLEWYLYVGVLRYMIVPCQAPWFLYLFIQLTNGAKYIKGL